MAQKAEPRFRIVYKENIAYPASDHFEIIEDTATGIHYLRNRKWDSVSNYGSMVITPLLGKDGKPVIEPVDGSE